MKLPFCNVEDFDYPNSRMIDEMVPDIIWVALGALKQEIFMSRLKPYLKKGVMIAVGAAFKFYSGTDVKRSPIGWLRCILNLPIASLANPRNS